MSCMYIWSNLKSDDMVTLRFNYEVRWYEFNLTERRSRRFITETGALLYCFWLEHWHGAVAKIYPI